MSAPTLATAEDRPAALARLYVQATAHAAQGNLETADTLLRDVLAELPGHAPTLAQLGLVRANLGRRREAITLFRAALRHQPDLTDAGYNLAVLLRQQGDPDALAAFDAVLETDPGHLDALLGAAECLAAAGQPADAAMYLNRALLIDGDFAPAWVNLGKMLAQAGQHEAALDCCARVLDLRPHSAEAHFNAGTALKALGRRAEAAEHLQAALALDPAHQRARLNLGNLFKETERFAEAAACYEAILAQAPYCIEALNNLGHLRQEQGRAADAAALHARALALDPGNAHARMSLMVAQLPIAYRDEAEVAASRTAYAGHLADLAALADGPDAAALAAGIGASQPFYLPYQGQNDRDLQTLYGGALCRMMAALHPAAPPLPTAPRPGERIRVGIVSGFFRDHSNWKIPISGWLAGLDRTRFALTGYHTGTQRDAATEQARALCDRFVQGPLAPELWRATILRDAPHVLIYPEIGIDPTAVGLAAQRLAPVQCTSWGQPTTSGMPTIDFFLSSDLMEPDDADAHYTERLVRLPGLSIAYPPPEAPPGPPASRAALGLRAPLGLRNGATVFWCGQSLFKYLPRHDAIFPRIARAAGDCQFLFIRNRHAEAVNGIFHERLAAAFAAEGLRAEDHVVMLPYMAMPDFLASLGAADVFLDSLDWSGCNTMLESLVHDLPIVTMAGGLMRGRHGLGILRALGLGDMATQTPDEYCALATRLARDPAARAEFRQRIAAGKAALYADATAVRWLEEFLANAAEG